MCLSCVRASIGTESTLGDVVTLLLTSGNMGRDTYMVSVSDSGLKFIVDYYLGSIHTTTPRDLALVNPQNGMVTGMNGAPLDIPADGVASAYWSLVEYNENTFPAIIPLESNDTSNTTPSSETATNDASATTKDSGTNREDILIGYELETDSWPDNETDDDAYQDALTEWVDENTPDTSHFSSATCNRIREELYEAASEHVDESDYRTGMDYSNIANHLPGFKAHRDGSVSGPEIVLKTPQTIDNAKGMTDSLFSFVDEQGAEINEGCSFHVHISVKGRKHTYGLAIQALMCDYVLQQAISGRLPMGLLNRWCNGPLNSYFGFDLDSDKYNFVAHRPYEDYATWEFRCFGNIDNASDADTCIDVAVEAYCWAFAMVRLHTPNGALMRVFETTNKDSLQAYFTDLIENEIEQKLTQLRNIARRSA
jgi:hypothetical protein